MPEQSAPTASGSSAGGRPVASRLRESVVVWALLGAVTGLAEAGLVASASRRLDSFAELLGYAVLIDSAAFGITGLLIGLIGLAISRLAGRQLAIGLSRALPLALGGVLAGVLLALRWLELSGPDRRSVAVALFAAASAAGLVAAALNVALGARAQRRGQLTVARLTSLLAILLVLALGGVGFDLSGRFALSERATPAPAATALPRRVSTAQPIRPTQLPTPVVEGAPAKADTTTPILIPKESDGRPNLLLVTVDSFRGDHLGAAGYPRARTPVMDRLAAEGILFQRAYTHRNATTPAHATLFTGAYTSTHGVRSHMMDLLKPGVPTLAETLRDSGYITAGIYSWLAFEPAYSGLERGFQTYSDMTVNLPGYLASSRASTLAATYKRLKSLLALPAALDRQVALSEQVENEMDGRADVTTDGALLWLDEIRGREAEAERPFFLWVHYWDPHYPFTPPPELLPPGGCAGCPDGSMPSIRQIQRGVPPGAAETENLLRYYDGEIAFVDRELGRLLQGIQASGTGRDTLVVIVGDHGESFGEQGTWLHGGDLQESEIHVPLILRYPGRLPANRVESSIVRSADVMPTILELIDLPVPPSVEGASLLPLIEGREPPGARFAVAELADRSIMTILVGEWQLLVRGGDGAARLYRTTDPVGNRLDLSTVEPGVIDALRERLERWQTGHP